MPVREAKGDVAPAAGSRVSVVTGDEELLVERAVARLVAAAGGDGAAGVREVAAGRLAPGELAVVTAPSLFDATPVVPSPPAAAASRATARSTSSSSSPVTTLTRVPAAGATSSLASRTGMPPASHEAAR